MADTQPSVAAVNDGRISTMPEALTVAPADYVPVVTEAGENKKVKIELLNGRTAYALYAQAETDAGRTPLSQAAWLVSLKGADGSDGKDGTDGIDGATGKSAYELYVAGVPGGTTPLSMPDWLASLKGEKGTNGTNGTDGAAGKSAYEVYVSTVPGGTTPLTQAAWLASLKGGDGKDGKDGTDGVQGKSPYDIYVESVPNGQTPMDQTAWLASLKGEDGTDGTNGTNGADGKDGVRGESAYEVYVGSVVSPAPVLSEADWLASLKGTNGTNGKTAYELYVAGVPDGTTPMTQIEWLASLRGIDGKSAYQVYVTGVPGGTTPLTEAAWLASLKGKDGVKGQMGTGLNFIGTVDVGDALPDPATLSKGDTFVQGTHFQMNNVTEWTDLGDFGGPDGKSAYDLYAAIETAQGKLPLSLEDWIKSLQGPAGTGLVIRGELVDKTNLPTSAQLIGDTYIIKGYEYVWVGVDVSLDHSGWSVVGVQGNPGKSAYDIYVSGVAQGQPVLSQADWLLSLKGNTGGIGPDGKEGPVGPQGAGIVVVAILADQAALDAAEKPPVGHGYLMPANGNYYQWTGSAYLNLGPIKGANGTDGKDGTNGTNGTNGKSAYEVYVAGVPGGTTPLTQTEWLASLKGANGAQGKSLYQSYVDTTTDNPVKSEADWLVTMKVKGDDGKDGVDGKDGTAGGAGADGESAYQVYVGSVPEGETPLPVDSWLASLKGEDGTVGKSAYQSYLDTTADNPKLSEGEWLVSLQGKDISTKGSVANEAALPAGATAGDGYYIGQNLWVSTGVSGQWVDTGVVKGDTGPQGGIGPDGKTAYEVYVSTVPGGTTPLSLSDWLASLKGNKGTTGDTGNSAYDSYVATTADNPVKTEAAWIASLRGADGKDGDSGYAVYLANTSDDPKLTVAQWLESNKGKSAYQIYLDTTADNPKLSAADWLASLKGTNGTNGTNGKSAFQSYLDTTSDNPKLTEVQWNASLIGKTAYQSYVSTTADVPVKSEADWLLSLKGTNGTNGTNGKTAYEVYVSTVPGGTTPLTQSEWLNSLIGRGIIAKGVLADLTALNAVTGMVSGWMYYIGTVQYIYGLNAQGAPAWINNGDFKGPVGVTGQSAYAAYVAGVPSGTPVLSQADWLASLKGATGNTGPAGTPANFKGTVADVTALQAISTPANGDTYFLLQPAGEVYTFQTATGWVDVGNLKGIQGDVGPMGPGINILGSLATEGDLATAPQATLGQGYVISGEFWGWTGSAYQNMGKIQGPTGPQGIQGKAGPTGPIGLTGPDGKRGSIIILLPRDPQVTDGVVNDVYQNTATNMYYQKTSETNWAFMGTYGGGNVTDASHDGVMKVRQDGAWVALPVLEATADPSNSKAVMVRDPSTKTWKALDRYDLKIVDSTALTSVSMDLSVAQVFKIDGTKAVTLTIANFTAVDRMINIVLVIKGNGGNITWPTQLRWSNGTAPALGTTRTEIIMSWDGEMLMAAAGPTI